MEHLVKELFEKNYKDVYSYLYSLCRDASLSEDLASETFLEAFRSIGSFRGEADLKTWLFSIARYKWYGYLRRRKKQPETEALTELYVHGGKGPESRVLEQEQLERIYALLDQEPPRTREIVLMRAQGYSFYEIAQKYNISESSARVIEFRAKNKLRKILTEEGLGNE